MTEAQAYESIKARWLATWPTLQPAVPFAFKGEVIDSADEWVRVTIRPMLRVQATQGPAGGRRFEDRGTIFVQVFTPVDGEARELAIVASVREVFESRTIDSEELVTFSATRRAAADGKREGEEDGRWNACTVSIPYWFDEQK